MSVPIVPGSWDRKSHFILIRIQHHICRNDKNFCRLEFTKSETCVTGMSYYLWDFSVFNETSFFFHSLGMQRGEHFFICTDFWTENTFVKKQSFLNFGAK